MKNFHYVDLLQSKHATEIIRLNFAPFYWIHKSWYKKLGIDVLRPYLNEPETERLAQKMALQKMGIFSLYTFDFAHKGSRLALLPCVQLEILSFYIGMLRYTDYLESNQMHVNIASSNWQKEFKHFIHHIAPFLLNESSYEGLYIREENIENPKQVTKNCMFLEGSHQLTNLIQYESEAIKKRFLYKMPKGSINLNQASDISADEYSNMLRIATKINYLINDTENEPLNDKSLEKLVTNIPSITEKFETYGAEDDLAAIF